MPWNEVVQVKKIENSHLRKQFETELEGIKSKHQKDPLSSYTRFLFHGTSTIDPKKIYNSEKGFLIQFASDANKWGPGVYFAENASYSGRKYSFQIQSTDTEKLYQMFLAEVIVGDVYYSPQPDKSLFLPPLVPCEIPWKNAFEDERYDSVCGQDHGSDIYIVYENSRAYPLYLITYKKEVKNNVKINKKS